MLPLLGPDLSASIEMGKREGEVLGGLLSRLLGNICEQVSRLAQDLFKRKGWKLTLEGSLSPLFYCQRFCVILYHAAVSCSLSR